MSDIDNIVAVSVTTETKTVTQEGFGTPLIGGYHAHYLDLVREYDEPSGLLDDSFTTADPIYKTAQKIFSQNPRPKSFKVGRFTSAPTQIIEITPLIVVTGTKYSGKVNGLAWTYTQGGTQTVAAACTGIQTAIDALAGVTAAVHTSTSVRVTTDAAGAVLPYSFDQAASVFTVGDITADPGIAAELAAISVADDDWYGLVLASNSPAEILAAAAVIEAQHKVFVAETGDTAARDGTSTTDVAAAVQTAGYKNTAVLVRKSIASFGAGGWLGGRLTTQPGSDTWAFKSIAGVDVEAFTAAEKAAIKAKNANYYTLVAGVGVTLNGTAASGQFMDVTRFVHWLIARLQESVFSTLVNAPKVPFTDAGVDVVRSALLAVTKQGVRVGGLAAEPAPQVLAPLVADVSDIDRAARRLPDVSVQGRLAGAIHDTDVLVTISV